MDKIVILGAGEFQLHLIEKAKEKGLFTIVVSPEGDYPGFAIADKIYYHDATDAEFITEIAEKEGAIGVTSDQGEIFVKTIAYACEKLGLPGNPYEVAKLYTDKGLMRKRGMELGLPTIEYHVADSYEEAVRCFRAIGRKSIIKPLDGFSSRGVYQIEDEKMLEEYYPKAVEVSKQGKVIIERYVEGRVLEVDSIVLNGEVRTLMHAEIYDFSIPNVFSSRMRLYPIVEEAASLDKLLEYNRRIGEGFGVRQGITHNEYMLEKETGEVYLIEAALRSGGAFVGSSITQAQTGLDPADFLVDIAAGRADRFPDFDPYAKHTGTVAFYIPIGKVISLKGLDEVDALDYVMQTTFHKLKEGFVSDRIEDKDQRQLISLEASSREELMERISHIRDMIRIEVETDAGIRGPIWE